MYSLNKWPYNTYDYPAYTHKYQQCFFFHTYAQVNRCVYFYVWLNTFTKNLEHYALTYMKCQK